MRTVQANPEQLELSCEELFYHWSRCTPASNENRICQLRCPVKREKLLLKLAFLITGGMNFVLMPFMGDETYRILEKR